ncbi:P-loop NTPase fold protein [Paenibacillus sp. FSL H7-0350]|uniref:P-loop NTPase fold protein n=1 Tax=Paenibacillus sp. FSL H7-0350 TaxID=2975345 RepID=UPI0031583E81
MQPNDILKIIDNYIEKPETDYAIMIEQGWGAGKTYFWNNTVAPHLLENGYFPCHITLNGVSSIEEVSTRTLLGLRQAVYLKPGLDPLEIDQYIDIQKLVLCYDDLERANMDVEDIFGYTNLYIEHKNIKTLFLCNEGKIHEREDEQRKKYAECKEKIIGKTIPFKQLPRVALEQMIDKLYQKYDSKYKDFLKERVDPIIELFEIEINDYKKIDRNINLRTVKHSLSDFHYIYDKCNNTFDNLIPELDQFLLLTIILSKEIKFNSGIYSAIEKTKTQKVDRSDSLLRPKIEETALLYDVLEKYTGHTMLRGSINYLHSIGNYLLTGNLIMTELKEDIDSFQNKQESLSPIINIDPETQLFDRYWELDDNEFSSAIDNVMKKVESKKYLLMDYLRISNHFAFFRKENLLNFPEENDKKLIDTFKEAIDFAIESIDATKSYSSVLSGFDPTDSETSQLKKYVENKLKEKREQDYQSKANELTQLLLQQPDLFVKKLYKYNQENLPIFMYIDPTQFVNNLFKLNNRNLTEVRNVIVNRYQSFNAYSYTLEVKTLIDIRDYLLEILGRNNDTSIVLLSTRLLKQFSDDLNGVIDKISLR